MVKKEKKMQEGMVDVSGKNITKRTAIASSQIKMSKKAFDLFVKEGSPKGDVLETAKVAGIMAAKNTPLIIPMCHPLSLDKVKMELSLNRREFSVLIKGEVVCHGKTGVEMEALVAVSAAALTVYDMMKWADHGMVISDVQLLYKEGGRSGIYKK